MVAWRMFQVVLLRNLLHATMSTFQTASSTMCTKQNNFLMSIVLQTSWCAWALPLFVAGRFELQHSSLCVPISMTAELFVCSSFMLLWKGDLAIHKSVDGIMMNGFNLIRLTIYKFHFMSCTDIVSFVIWPCNLWHSDSHKICQKIWWDSQSFLAIKRMAHATMTSVQNAADLFGFAIQSPH